MCLEVNRTHLYLNCHDTRVFLSGECSIAVGYTVNMLAGAKLWVIDVQQEFLGF
ncbi:hypothetical protein [Umezakia ovalisporum]|uniref:Uncharacterized protein n=1 Tax=Umezakia ovalisporum FSS-62 TaxID=2971776 RepID=A0AA43GX57_9CYAN|nr:hypothetical protein [Umezakia ovalisporum]MDH6062867.1 hypothetical protein [Umezakia ovalisporum FSS-62]